VAYLRHGGIAEKEPMGKSFGLAATSVFAQSLDRRSRHQLKDSSFLILKAFMKPLIALAVLLGSSTLFAQVSETIDVHVINVDVTVTSKSGPVRGLTREDFEIFEDGKLQPITNFYASDEIRAVPAAAAPGAPSGAPPAEQQDPRFRRKVLVLVDSGHTVRQYRDTALRELEAMITDRFHGDYEWSIGVIGRGISLVLPLSSDKQAIHEALETIRLSGTRKEGAASFAEVASEREGGSLVSNLNQARMFDPNFTARFQQDQLERAESMDDAERVLAAKLTVPAYLDAVRGFASTSGRKIVLLLTGDPGLNDVEVDRHEPGKGEFTNIRATGPSATKLWQNQRTIEDLRRSIVQEANASDTSFYMWNVDGLNPAGDLGIAPRPITDTSALFWLARETGGRLVTGNDAAGAVREFDTASSTFYSLGYSPAHTDDGKYHAISVRMKRKGDYTLEYRTGYSDTSTAVQLERAMKSPTAAAMQESALPVTLAFGAPQTVRNEVTVPIEVAVPFRTLQFLPGKKGVAANLVIYVTVFDDTGKNVAASSFALTPGFKSGTPDPKGTLVYRNAIKLRGGERHRVVVAIRDAVTDSIGMATQVVRF
jgi:VWFA-related protein